MHIENRLLVMDAPFCGSRCYLRFDKYTHGDGVRMELRDVDDHYPVATCTVNVPSADLSPNEVFIKDYSENEGVLDYLVSEGVVDDRVEADMMSGQVIITAHRLTNEVLKYIEPLKLIL